MCLFSVVPSLPQESLVVMNEVNAVLIKMFATGEGEAPEGGGADHGSMHALGTVDEEGESAAEVGLDKITSVPKQSSILH